MLLARTSLSVALILLAAPLLRADVLVVDAEGGGDYTTLSAAVLAAADGDTILVHDGEYLEPAPVVVDGKPLSIVANWFDWFGPPFGPTVTIRPGLVVRNLAPNEFVILENLALRGAVGTATAAPTAGLVLLDNSSHVRAQSCAFTGGDGASNAFPHGAAGVDVQNSYSAALTACRLFGGDGQFSPSIGIVTGNGGPGLSVVGGQVHLSQSDARGGSGGSDAIGGFGQGGVGGAGVAHVSGTLLIVSTLAQGGEGGTSFHGGDGGDGLHLSATGFAWLMAGSGAIGGSGGPSDSGPNGDHGNAIVDPGGIVTDYGGTPHDFDVTSPLREGQGGMLTFGGDFQSSKLVFASLSLHQLPFPDKQGVLMLFPDALIGPFALGSGSNQTIFVVPNLPAALPAVNVHLQAVYVLSSHSVSLGAGRVLTLLDSTYF